MKGAVEYSFVVDASIAMAWVHPTQANDYANSGLKAFLVVCVVLVLCLWLLEVANVLVVLSRGARLRADEREEALRRVSKLPVAIDYEGPKYAFARIAQLAVQFGLSVCDATYLELALRTGLPLACKDETLRAAAAKARVKLWRPPQ